jgi:hypothetical protein
MFIIADDLSLFHFSSSYNSNRWINRIKLKDPTVI